VPVGVDCISPSRHSAFSTPIEMMQFIAKLRELSGGKPVGFKLCIGHPWEFLAICKAMLETEIYPDFIVVDGKEGGTGAAPLNSPTISACRCAKGCNFVHNALIGIGCARPHQDRRQRQDHQRLRHRPRHGAGRRLVQFGARLHVRARLHPVAELPHRPLPDRRRDAGPGRQRALVVPDKAERVYNFHRATDGGAGRAGGRGRARSPDRILAGAFLAARFAARGQKLRRALSDRARLRPFTPKIEVRSPRTSRRPSGQKETGVQYWTRLTFSLRAVVI
jgi:hypothetical protein